MYEKIKNLAAQHRKAKTKEQKEKINAAMMELQNANPQAYVEAQERLIAETSERLEALTAAEYRNKQQKK